MWGRRGCFFWGGGFLGGGNIFIVTVLEDEDSIENH